MSDEHSKLGYNLMKAAFAVQDFFAPYIPKRIRQFGLKEGMTLVDYGCGPGRYTIPMAKTVGEGGKVYAVDLNPLSLEDVKEKAAREGLKNVVCAQARGFHAEVPSGIADAIVAVDMFFYIRAGNDRVAFFKELARIAGKGCRLVIDGGHITMEETKKRIEDAEVWKIESRGKDFFICGLKEE